MSKRCTCKDCRKCKRIIKFAMIRRSKRNPVEWAEAVTYARRILALVD